VWERFAFVSTPANIADEMEQWHFKEGCEAPKRNRVALATLPDQAR
jgi:hypothetical protein